MFDDDDDSPSANRAASRFPISLICAVHVLPAILSFTNPFDCAY